MACLLFALYFIALFFVIVTAIIVAKRPGDALGVLVLCVLGVGFLGYKGYQIATDASNDQPSEKKAATPRPNTTAPDRLKSYCDLAR